MGKDYAGTRRNPEHCYDELVITDMKEEPYTPTEIVDSPTDLSQQTQFVKPEYDLLSSLETVEISVEQNRRIHVQRPEYARLECRNIDILKELQSTMGTVMDGGHHHIIH